jgi:hypothetical protein
MQRQQAARTSGRRSPAIRCGKVVAWSTGWTAAAALALAAAALPASAARLAGTGHVAAASATITVQLTGKTDGSLPARYIGLSFESDLLNGGQFDDVGDLPRLLEDLGVGTLRFGGSSVDRIFTRATPAALSGLRRLVNATGWHVIYSEDLGHFDAAQVTSDAKAAAAALGGKLTSIACGNEPDNFAATGLRPASYTEADYLTEANACIKAIRAGAPHAQISGPDTINVSWLPAYATAEKGTISLLTEHYYPLSNCGKVKGTALDLLSRATAATEAATVSKAKAAASIAGVPLQMTETNSAECSGIHGVSNTYASALWTIDYLLIGAQNGASGMNFHGGLSTACGGYTPLCQVGTNRYAAQPVYYGMLFTHLLGTGTLLRVGVKSAGNTAAHAITSGGKVRVVVENLSGAAETVKVRAGDVSGTATVLHLTGPSLAATGGVRIQGAQVKADGAFAPGRASRLACHSGACVLKLAPYSAVIITLPGHPH